MGCERVHACDFCFGDTTGGVVWDELLVSVPEVGTKEPDPHRVHVRHHCCVRCIPKAPASAREAWFTTMGETALKLAAHYRATGVWQ